MKQYCTYVDVRTHILTYGGILTYGSMLYVGSTTYVGRMTYVDIMDICWRMGECICWHMHSIMQYEPNTNIWKNIGYYKSVCRNMNSYYAIWTLCRHTKQYCTLHIRTSKYGLKFSNMNHMSKYETILHITNPCVGIWTHIEQYELYVAIWNNTAYYKPICRHMDLYCTI